MNELTPVFFFRKMAIVSTFHGPAVPDTAFQSAFGT